MNKVRCPICKQNFDQQITLHDHLNSCMKKNQSQQSTTLNNLQSNGIYKCKTCNKIFTKLSQLIHHEKEHSISTMHKCDQCGKTYADKGTLKDHLNIHTKEKLYRCTICGRTYEIERSFLHHWKLHGFTYKCFVCNNLFLTRKLLAKHVAEYTTMAVEAATSTQTKNQHNSAMEEPKFALPSILDHSTNSSLQCPICKRIFTEHARVLSHINMCSSTIKRRLFNYKPHFIKSLDEAGKTIYSCNWCEVEYNCYTSIVIHLRRYHTGQNPYPCQDCDQSFMTSDELKYHTIEHSGKNPLECDKCEKIFKYRGSFEKHRVICT